MKQRQLFETTLMSQGDFEPCDKSVMDEERPRLGNQCRLILDRLRCGRASNIELAAIALKYTSRVSDLRKAGYDVRCVARDHATGLTFYELSHS